MIKKFNYYTGSTILGYKLVNFNLATESIIGDIPISKPIINNDKGVDYNCDKKLLKTNYRKRKKTQLRNRDLVVTIE